MEMLITWTYVLIAVVVAVIANTISTIWARRKHTISIWFFALLLISPVVFITFGLVTSRVGLALASGTIDALLTISTVMVGLSMFREWKKLGRHEYAGLLCILLGIVFMQFPF